MGKKKDTFIMCNGYAKMLLTNRDGNQIGEVLLDPEDVAKCMQYKWCAQQKKGEPKYVRATINGKAVQMHRLIMNYYGSLEIDHINGNGLDNRKSNLRIVPQKENASNRKDSAVQQTPDGRWIGIANTMGQRITTEAYTSKEEAALAREEILRKAKNKESEFIEFCKNNIELSAAGVTRLNDGRWLATVRNEGNTTTVGEFDSEIEAWYAQVKKLGATEQEKIDFKKAQQRDSYARQIKNYSADLQATNKYALSIDEAAEYFNIGQNKLRAMVKENAGADWILTNRTHVHIKRRLFEEYLNERNRI